MDKLIIHCCSCGGHFAANSAREIKSDVIHGKYYICNGCYEAIPQSNEPVQTLYIVRG